MTSCALTGKGGSGNGGSGGGGSGSGSEGSESSSSGSSDGAAISLLVLLLGLTATGLILLKFELDQMPKRRRKAGMLL